MTDAASSPADMAHRFGHWDTLDQAKFRNEREAVASNLAHLPLDPAARQAVVDEAVALVEHARASQKKQGVVESFLQEFSLGTREGLALMCLAEALLRTPDEDTRDRLIAEKIGSADWASHIGQSDSLFVNASTWGLMLTGKLVDADEEAKSDLPGFLKRVAGRLGEPVIRQAVAAAVRIMGEQFVVGRTIEAALKRSNKEGWLCSFDMLGEGARTTADAERYERIYADAITAVGKTAKGQGPEAGHGVSVKLSALSPRYEATHEDRVWTELYPRIHRLARIAAQYDINFTMDAEEADRLALSLKLLDRLSREADLGGWTGLGLAVQAYQKRAPEVIARLSDLSRSSGRRLMVRLVKGAYWDTEIKRAQVMGRTDYPVFTTKAATDLNYLVCARMMIDAAPHLYSQFATHNAHSLAAVHRMAREKGVKIEFQRLHGMGEALYEAAAETFGDQNGGMTVRAYAPVGGHEDLLPYLVRRLLENGANSSFVHALLDERVPSSAVAADPISAVEAHPDRHAKIPTPKDMYMDRQNSLGRDYSQKADRDRHALALEKVDSEKLTSGPIIGGKLRAGTNPSDVLNPYDGSTVLGHVSEASEADIDAAADAAAKAQVAWDRSGGSRRAHRLAPTGAQGQQVRVQARLVEQAYGLGRDQGGLFGGLGQDGVPGGQGRCDLAGEDGQGEVPGADAGKDAAAVQDQLVDLSDRTFQLLAPAEVAFGQHGIVAAEVGSLAHLGHAVVQGLARLTGQQGDQPVHVGFQRIGHGAQDRGAACAALAIPGDLGLGGGVQGRVDFCRRGLGHMAQHLVAIQRIGHVLGVGPGL